MNYLNQNLENQELYSIKFNEILDELDFLEKDEEEKMRKINKKMTKITNKVRNQIMIQMINKSKMKQKINLCLMQIWM